MWNEYAREKIEECERELRRSAHAGPAVPEQIDHEDVARPFRGAARRAGAYMRRIGESLERWAVTT